MAAAFAGSKYTKSVSGVSEHIDNDDQEKEEDEDEDSAETGSTTSFSLQECINEFRARRIRRVSTQSREVPVSMMFEEQAPAAGRNDVDTDLINQNRCNKAQERKCKPCKNGFCYCFTSDSGDCASTAPTRESHVRQQRRSRRSESNKPPVPQQLRNNLDNQQRRQRQSLPHNIKLSSSKTLHSNTSPLTAVSSLHAVADDAPLIHIIQELRDNCVISEVRVNKQKLHTTGKTIKPVALKMQSHESVSYKPTAPALSNISEQETPPEDTQEEEEHEVQTDSLHSPRPSSLKNSRRHSGGRLLQKRLSHGQVNFKPRDAKHPPPKPPRRSTQSLDGKCSLSSLTSTTPSVREAERVLDEFLLNRGVQLPTSNVYTTKSKSKRKSFPLSEIEKHKTGSLLPTCPSLSDIERVVESKRGTHYAKNIHVATGLHRKVAVVDKPMKEIMLGWTEPKITDMLNYDVKTKRADTDDDGISHKQQQFKSKASQAAAQSAIGWQMPHKISLDTVDGPLSENLASNMEKKHTPIKYPRLKNVNARVGQKGIWGEQWHNLSPWNGKKRSHKSNGLRNKSKNFLNNSKKKILRFVSPKKSNRQVTKSAPSLRTVAVQTSQLDLHTLESQSPPGSYHSPVQSCGTSGTASATSPTAPEKTPQQQQTDFDFKRKVKPPTPPKKQPRAQRARKLEFSGNSPLPGAPTTYRSYHKDLDQDVTINKMGYVLSSIRAKLEASDERAMRTFRECSHFERLERAESPSFDCPDSQREVPRHLDSEPIYSEIEEDCLHIRGSPQYESRTAAQMVTTALVSTPTPSPESLGNVHLDFSALYAKVHKPLKAQTLPTATPLGQFLQESLKNGSFFKFMPLPEAPDSESSYTSSTFRVAGQRAELSQGGQSSSSAPIPPPLPPTLPIHQSLNNIHEKHSPPKQIRNLSKSELSLQRSEIFLENLCRSEILLDPDDNARLEKVENTPRRASMVTLDNVSYDLPHECQPGLYNDFAIERDHSYYATNGQSQYGSGQIEPPPSENQSTPKKQSPRFTTKPTHSLSIDITDGRAVRTHNMSNSCPTTPHQHQSNSGDAATGVPVPATHAHSVDELPLSTSTLARYRLLKDALRRSYRKGKNFFRAEKQRLANSLNLSRDQSNQTEVELDSSSQYVNFDTLMNETLSTTEQLAQAVSICRQIPELEISAEMVEAERLLLFSSLRTKTPPRLSEALLAAQRQAQCFFIDAMQLPVKANASQDMFFNYYYIGTFECDGRICSSQSVECQNGAAMFRDCGIEFYSSGAAEALELRCQIFMLRLRKVSTLSLEPQKSLLKRASLGSASSTSSSSNGEPIISRFRLHASFTLRACDLVPYELVASETRNSNKLCLRSSRSWQLPITAHTKSTNLDTQILLTGRAELRLPKLQHVGYLNVQDPKNQHNWNRRWCTLLGLQLNVWQHEENLTGQPPLMDLPLQTCHNAPLAMAPRELCARARSFLVDCADGQYYFAADTQSELSEWLQLLNEALTLAQRWLNTTQNT